MCGGKAMPTNLAIDDKLIEDARRIGKHRTKREAVNEALREYVQHRKQLQVLDLFHTIDLDPAYDYKKQRKRT
jgi:Arc/MetJ family transcription regulator